MWIRARYSDGQPFRLPYPHLKWTKWLEVPDDYDKEHYVKLAEEAAPGCNLLGGGKRMQFVEMEESKERPPGAD